MKTLAAASTLLLLLLPAAAQAGDPPPSPHVIPVDFVGQLQMIPGVPCGNCLLTVEGTPISARTTPEGFFVLTGVPSGPWTVTAKSEDGEQRLQFPLRKPFIGETRDTSLRHVMYLPTIVLSKPGAVTGKVEVSSTDDLDDVVVGIPELGLFVQPNIGGVFLLTGVAPGNYTLIMRNGIQRWRTRPVSVNPGDLTTNASFLLPSRP